MKLPSASSCTEPFTGAVVTAYVRASPSGSTASISPLTEPPSSEKNCAWVATGTWLNSARRTSSSAPLRNSESGAGRVVSRSATESSTRTATALRELPAGAAVAVAAAYSATAAGASAGLEILAWKLFGTSESVASADDCTGSGPSPVTTLTADARATILVLDTFVWGRPTDRSRRGAGAKLNGWPARTADGTLDSRAAGVPRASATRAIGANSPVSAAWILRSVRAGVPALGEPVFR